MMPDRIWCNDYLDGALPGEWDSHHTEYIRVSALVEKINKISTSYLTLDPVYADEVLDEVLAIIQSEEV